MLNDWVIEMNDAEMLQIDAAVIEANGELYAYILDVPNFGTKLELRRNPEQAKKHRYFDPISCSSEHS